MSAARRCASSSPTRSARPHRRRRTSPSRSSRPRSRRRSRRRTSRATRPSGRSTGTIAVSRQRHQGAGAARARSPCTIKRTGRSVLNQQVPLSKSLHLLALRHRGARQAVLLGQREVRWQHRPERPRARPGGSPDVAPSQGARWRSPSRRSPEPPRRRVSHAQIRGLHADDQLRQHDPDVGPVLRPAPPDPDAVIPLGWGKTGAGGGAPSNGSGAPAERRGRNLTTVIYEYWDGMVAATANNPRVAGDQEVPRQDGHRTARHPVLRRRHRRATSHNLDGPDGDAAFWRGVRSGTDLRGGRARGRRRRGRRSRGSRRRRTAASPPRASRSRASSTSCWRARTARTRAGSQILDVFLQPVRNPDGRDGVTRTTAWGFDPNRDFGTQNQQENKIFVPEMNQYPGVFFIDAHQTVERLLLPAQRGPGPPRDQPLRAGLHPERDRPGAAGRVQRPVDRVPQLQPVRPLHAGVRRHGALADHGRRRHDLREGHQRGLRQAGL